MSQTEQRRSELLEKIEKIAESNKYNLDGLIYILAREDFDARFPEHFLDLLQKMLDGLLRQQMIVLDAVQTVLMKLD